MDPARFDEMRPGLLRHRRPRRRHGPRRHLGLAVLPVARVGLLRRRSTRGRGTRTSGLACLRACNDWHLEVWAGDLPERIIPLQLPWLDDVGGGGGGDRGATRPGASRRSASPSSRPSWACPPIFSGVWDPFFAACEETATVVCLHTGSRRPGPRCPRPTRPSSSSPPSSRSTPCSRPANGCGRACALRFPDLNVAHVRRRHRLGADAHGPGRLRADALGLGHGEHRRGRRTCGRARCCGATSGSAPSTTPPRWRYGTGSASTTSWSRATTRTPTRPGPTPSSSSPRTWGSLPDDELRAVAGGNAARPVPPPAAPGRRLAHRGA